MVVMLLGLLIQCITLVAPLVNKGSLTGQSEQIAMLAAIVVLRDQASRMGRTGWTDFVHISRGVQRAYEA